LTRNPDFELETARPKRPVDGSSLVVVDLH